MQNITTIIGIFIISCMLMNCTPQMMQQVLTQPTSPIGLPLPLTEGEVASGLKQALSVGTDSAVKRLMSPNGFLADAAVRILLPDELQKAVAQLRSTQEGEKIYQSVLKSLVEDSLVKCFNRAAEDAVVEATPIFKNAITSMTIADAFGILRGSDSSATIYLRNKTYHSLQNSFQPKVNVSLDRKLMGLYSPNEVWSQFYDKFNYAADSYNLIAKGYNIFNSSKPLPLVDKLQTASLSEYVTTKALDGVFVKIQDTEKDIRANPLARVTELLQRVFGSK